jgi:hypothetical protein
MQGTANFGGQAFSVGGSLHVYVAEFSAAAGDHLFSTVLGQDGTTAIGDVIGVDAANAIFIAGHFEGTLNLGGSDLVSSVGGHDLFLAKLSANGVHQWSERFGAQGDELTNDLQMDSNGSVLTSGILGGNADFGGGPVSLGVDTLYVAKWDGLSVHQFSKGFRDPFTGQGAANGFVTTDAAGNVFVTGSTRGNIDFGGGEKAGGAGLSVAFVAMDATGAHVASAIYDGGSEEYADGIAADPTGGAVVVGHFPTTLDFGDSSGPLVSAGGFDMFVAHITP